MSNSAMVHIRMDEQLKTQATLTLAAMGLSLSDAVRVFLTRVTAEQALPFALKVPNAASKRALEESEKIHLEQGARFDNVNDMINELEKASIK